MDTIKVSLELPIESHELLSQEQEKIRVKMNKKTALSSLLFHFSKIGMKKCLNPEYFYKIDESSDDLLENYYQSTQKKGNNEQNTHPFAQNNYSETTILRKKHVIIEDIPTLNLLEKALKEKQDRLNTQENVIIQRYEELFCKQKLLLELESEYLIEKFKYRDFPEKMEVLINELKEVKSQLIKKNEKIKLLKRMISRLKHSTNKNSVGFFDSNSETSEQKNSFFDKISKFLPIIGIIISGIVSYLVVNKKKNKVIQAFTDSFQKLTDQEKETIKTQFGDFFKYIK